MGVTVGFVVTHHSYQTLVRLTFRHTQISTVLPLGTEWGLERKEDGEPAEHVWCVCCWDNAEGDVLVQSGLEEATKLVHDTVERHSKGESAISKAFTL